jgi:ATP-binding cassette subfamily B protein
MNGISRRIENDLRDDFFAHLVRLDSAFYGTTRTGDLMSRATNDTQAVRMAVGPGIMYLVNTTVTTAVSLALMLRYSVSLALIAIIPLALLPFVMIHFGRRIHRQFDRIQEQFGTLSTMVQWISHERAPSSIRSSRCSPGSVFCSCSGSAGGK